MLIYKLAHLCLCYCVLKFPLDFVNVLSFWLNRFFVVVFWFPFSPEEAAIFSSAQKVHPDCHKM